MSIQIEASYCKKLGLPNFSSHSFLVTVRAELSSLHRLETESARLYRLLQDSVDKQVEQVGFLPDATTYGLIVDSAAASNGSPTNGHQVSSSSDDDGWACSVRQKDLILKLATQEQLSPAALDDIAQRLHRLPVPALNKKQASGFISELLAIIGPAQLRRRSNSTKASTISE
jgi:hypothetical protein